MTSELRSLLQRTVADRYRLGRELGRGGMATVYLAEDLRHRRNVAVKLLHAELSEGLSAARFLREIEITAQLLHPHVVTLIDSGEADGLLYYVMPYVEGESLRGRLDREGELPVVDAVRILREVADALAYAHRRGIVHRDIKPENVLLTGSHAMVTDFGVAKAVATAVHDAQASDDRALTSLGIALGTPAYMSPEQAAGDPYVDQRSDVYALGVLVYEILAGVPPFAGATAQQVIAAHFGATPEPLARRRPSVPAALEQLVMRCLEKRAADRWQSADELLRRLDAIAISEAEPARVALIEPVERTFRLTEDVCRRLDRATLDPRIIGDVVHYLDNQVESPVLVCFVHGTGYDQRQFDRILRMAPCRAIAPTLYGFEPETRRRHALSLEDHLVILRELLRDAVARLRPELTLLVGFSSGADVVLRLAASSEFEPRPLIDGLLAVGSNLSIETCFVTQLLARIDGDDPESVLEALRSFGASASTLDDWLNVHEYLVATLRKFHDDVAPLRRFSADVVRPFADGGDSPFARWYREASARVRLLRCVYEETPMIEAPLRALRLRNLDDRILGPRHREGALVIEPDTDHFDLVEPGIVLRHVEEMVRALREPAS